MFSTVRRITPLIMIFPFLAACQSDGGEGLSGIDSRTSANPFSQSDPYTGGDYDTPLPKPVLSFTAAEAGPLGPTPTYSKAEVEARLPGFETAYVQTAREDKTANTLAALYRGQQAIQLFKGAGGRAAEIHAVNGIVAGPNGEQVGMTFRQAGMSRSNCRVGRNLWRGMAICPSRGASNVKLVFALPGYRGPYHKMPPENAIGDATLQRFVWIPRQ